MSVKLTKDQEWFLRFRLARYGWDSRAFHETSAKNRGVIAALIKKGAVMSDGEIGDAEMIRLTDDGRVALQTDLSPALSPKAPASSKEEGE